MLHGINGTDIELAMTSIWKNPIWDHYQTHRDIDRLRNDILTTPWYRKPEKLNDSLLEFAIVCGDLAAVKLIIELGEKPTLPADNGFPVLHLAVDRAEESTDSSRDAVKEIIETLIQHGADPNALGMDGSALHRAAGGGSIDAAQALLKGGADIESRMLTDGELTPLVFAALMDQPEMVRFLLRAGADRAALSAPSLTDKGGKTAKELVIAQNSPSAPLILKILQVTNS
jgi:ankyrin repeat protein